MKLRTDGLSHFAGLEVAGDPDVAGNGLDLLSAGAGSAPSITAVGDDTDIDIAITPKGAGRLRTTEGVGAKNGATVTATEYGFGPIHQTKLVLAATPITVRDTQQGGGVKIYDFPAGVIQILGATGTAQMTTTSVVASTLHAGSNIGRWGVGSVTQANATLATTEQDILPVTTYTTAAKDTASTATTAILASQAQWDGTSTAIDAFFNISVPTGTDIDADASVTVAATIYITWINHGDV